MLATRLPGGEYDGGHLPGELPRWNSSHPD